MSDETEEEQNWGPDKPMPSNYRLFQNSSGIDFYVPLDQAPANVPYSFEVFAGSINKDQITNGDQYLRLDGSKSMTGDLDIGAKNIVDANDVSSTTATVSGQSTAGSVVVSNVVAPDTAAGRNITHSLSEPTGGKDGDIWFTYKDE